MDLNNILFENIILICMDERIAKINAKLFSSGGCFYILFKLVGSCIFQIGENLLFIIQNMILINFN